MSIRIPMSVTLNTAAEVPSAFTAVHAMFASVLAFTPNAVALSAAHLGIVADPDGVYDTSTLPAVAVVNASTLDVDRNGSEPQPVALELLSFQYSYVNV